MTTFISRRELLRRAGLAGAAAVVAPKAALAVEAQVAAPTRAVAAREAFEHLTSAESNVLEAIVSRLIPTDASGPGATEARAAHYIDRALGNALASSHQAYSNGLAALDRYARSARGAPFAELSPKDQDDLLSELEAGTANGFPESSAFFNMVRSHTIQGTFCDPYYGGNANFVGWDLIGYPGVRTSVDPDEQRLGADLTGNHKGAYDYEMFTKASASIDAKYIEMKHGD
jgi:gluconate 2-dehydrogenase gamma chain